MRLEPKTWALLLIALFFAGLLISLFAFLIAPARSITPAMRIDPGQTQHTTSDRELTIELTGEGLPDDLQASINRDIDNHDQIIDWFNLPGNAQRFVINGRYGYLATGYQGLHIIDIDNPKSLRVIGSVASHGLAWDLIVRDQTVFLTVDGLQIFDVSQPTAPRTLATLPLPGTVLLDLAIAGNTLYAGSAKGLQIFDITDTTAPRHIDSVPCEGGPWALAVKDNLLLLSLREQKQEWLKIFDISKPHAPKELSAIQLPRRSWGIAVRGKHLYLPIGPAGISIIDISNPVNPQILLTANKHLYIDYISLDKDRAYGTSQRGDFYIFQIESATRLQLIGEVGLPPTGRPAVLRNNVAYVASGGFGLLSVDVSHPRPFKHSTALIKSAFISSVQNNNDLFYFSDSKTGVSIARRMDNDGGIGILSKLALPAGAKKFAKIANLLCVLEQFGNSAIFIDVTDPHRPLKLGELALENELIDVTANGTHFFVIDNKGLQIIDAADPFQPQVVSTTPITDARRILLHGTRLYVAKTAGTELLNIFDVSNPKAPLITYRYQLPWQMQGMVSILDVTRADDRLILSVGQFGLFIFDIGQTGTPALVENINLDDSAKGLDYANGLLYVTTDSGVLWVLKREGETFIQVAGTMIMGRVGILRVDDTQSALLSSDGKGPSFIPLPQPIPINIVAEQRHLQLRIPPGQKPGDYQVNLITAGMLIPYTTVHIDPATEGTPDQKL